MEPESYVIQIVERGETTGTFESLSKEDKSYCSDFRDACINKIKHERPPFLPVPVALAPLSIPVPVAHPNPSLTRYKIGHQYRYRTMYKL